MIYIGNELDLDKAKYDENWMIVRKPGELPDFVRHEPALSPSIALFQKYREAYHAGKFDDTFFRQVYVPQFIKELSENHQALSILKMLVELSKEKDILLACYCENEHLCHRSIIAGILLGMHAQIQADEAYIRYYEQLINSPLLD